MRTSGSPTVGELIHSLKFEAVWSFLIKHYPNQKDGEEGYQKVWQKLLTLQPKPNEMSVVIQSELDDEGEPWYNVSGIDLEGQTWAIEFEPWEEWLNMPVTWTGIAEMSMPEAMAHILWEMTFFGYDQADIGEQKQNLIDLKDDAIEKYKRGELQTLDEFLDEETPKPTTH